MMRSATTSPTTGIARIRVGERLTQITLPGGGKLGVYQPHHNRSPHSKVASKKGRQTTSKNEPSQRRSRKLQAVFAQKHRLSDVSRDASVLAIQPPPKDARAVVRVEDASLARRHAVFAGPAIRLTVVPSDRQRHRGAATPGRVERTLTMQSTGARRAARANSRP
jgi:hypothetical protein